VRRARIAGSYEFVEMYRGDKDLRMGRTLVDLFGHQFTLFVPDVPSPADSSLLGSYDKWREAVERNKGSVALVYMPARVIYFSRSNLGRGGFFTWCPRYPWALRKVRPDALIESVYTTLTSRMYFSFIASRLLGIPIMYVDAGDINAKGPIKSLLRRLEGFAVRNAGVIVTYSARGKRRFIEEYGVAPDKIRVIPKPIDTAAFSPDVDGAAFRKQFGLEGQRVVMYPGRLDFHKGTQYLIEIAAKVQDEPGFEDVRFVFVGANIVEVDQTRLDALLEQLQLKNVVVTGHLPSKEMPEALAAADLIVFPDVTAPIGFPTVLAEAMASGKAIVIGIKGYEEAVPAILKDFAILTRPRDLPELEAAIRLLLADEGMRRRLEEGVRRYAVDNMDWKSEASAYSDLLIELTRPRT
jgi:glycosyltransferase involved in cell wall biosynthesis